MLREKSVKPEFLTNAKSSQVLNNSRCYIARNKVINDQQETSVNNRNAYSNLVSPHSSDEFLDANRLFRVMSKFDALVIFSMAKDGIEADVSTPSTIGLTRKQYYTRLVQLKNAGLIHKKGKHYYQTTMGSFLYENCINAVIHAIKNEKRMSMIDVLKRQGNFTDEDLQKMTSPLLTIPKEK